MRRLLFFVLLCCGVTKGLPVAAHVTAERAGQVRYAEWDGAIAGDTATDRQALISALTALNDSGGGTLQLGPGVYRADNLPMANLNNIRILGSGTQKTILRVHTPGNNTPFLTCTSCTDFEMANFSFDANGTVTFGGLVFIDAKRVQIHDARLYDSNPQADTGSDRSSVIFANGTVAHEDIWLYNLLIQDLQGPILQSADRAYIFNNTIQRPLHNGIGRSSSVSGLTFQNVHIFHNTILDPRGNGIVIGLETTGVDNNIFRHIYVTDNLISVAAATPSFSRCFHGGSGTSQSGNIFSDWFIDRNSCLVDAAMANLDVMAIHAGSGAGVTDPTRIFLRDNIVTNGFFDLRRLTNSVVAGNVVSGGAKGFVGFAAFLNSVIEQNSAQVTETAYQFTGSRGGNQILDNRWLGAPTAVWSGSTGFTATDTVRWPERPQVVTVADNGVAEAATATLSPYATHVQIVCNDSDGCTLALGEGLAANGAVVTLENRSSNVCTFADTAGVTELAGAFTAGQYDSLRVRYSDDRWIEEGRVDN